MNNKLAVILGAAAGAAIMYSCDPSYGARRRALLRDKAVHAGKTTARSVSATARDAGHRLTGIYARAGRLFQEEEPPDDVVLVERVRAAIGHVSSHPGAIEVSASKGAVVLSGWTSPEEQQAILRKIRKVRGVQNIENRLRAA